MGYSEVIAYCHLELGRILLDQNDPDALVRLEQARDDFRALNDDHSLLTTSILLVASYRTSQPEKYIQLAQENVDLSLSMGDYNEAAWELFRLAQVLFPMGQLDRGESYLRKSLRLFEEIRYDGGCGFAKGCLGYYRFFQGDIDEARTLTEESYRQCVETNCTAGVRQATHCSSLLASIVDEDYARSRQFCNENIGLQKGVLLPGDHFVFAILACASKDFSQARFHAAKALGDASTQGHPTLQLIYLPLAALIYAHEGQFECAAEILGLVFTHPASPNGWLQSWGLLNRTHSHLQTKLGEARFATAWERGAEADLEEVVSLLLHEWQSLPVAKQPLINLLTERECEVISLIAAGLSNKQIADQLVVSIGTAKTHIHNIYGKLGVENRPQAIIRIQELKLVYTGK